MSHSLAKTQTLTKLKSFRPGRQAEMLPRAPPQRPQFPALAAQARHQAGDHSASPQGPTPNNPPAIVHDCKPHRGLLVHCCEASNNFKHSTTQRANCSMSGECMSWRMEMCALKSPLYFSRKGTIAGHSSNKWRSSQC